MSMIIRVSDISPRGLTIDDTISLEALNARMNEGHNNVILFTAPPHIEATVSKSKSGAEIRGKVTTRYVQPCSFCSREVECAMEVPLELILKPAGDNDGRKDEDPDFVEDVGIVTYENDSIDLEELLQESVILALSPYWRPDEDEHGNCTVCGINFEKTTAEKEQESKAGQNLGQLLKKAGIT